MLRYMLLSGSGQLSFLNCRPTDLEWFATCCDFIRIIICFLSATQKHAPLWNNFLAFF